MEFTVIRPEEWQESAFELIGRRWMLIGTENEHGVNAMTASWGGFGVLWDRPVIYLWVRPERYTHTLLEEAGKFSVNILPESQRETLKICGSVSGSDEDKIERCSLTVRHREGIPYFAESRMSALCRLVYEQPMEAGACCDYTMLESTLEKGNLHTLFIGEITSLLRRSDGETEDDRIDAL